MESGCHDHVGAGLPAIPYCCNQQSTPNFDMTACLANITCLCPGSVHKRHNVLFSQWKSLACCGSGWQLCHVAIQLKGNILCLTWHTLVQNKQHVHSRRCNVAVGWGAANCCSTCHTAVQHNLPLISVNAMSGSHKPVEDNTVQSGHVREANCEVLRVPHLGICIVDACCLSTGIHRCDYWTWVASV